MFMYIPAVYASDATIQETFSAKISEIGMMRWRMFLKRKPVILLSLMIDLSETFYNMSQYKRHLDNLYPLS